MGPSYFDKIQESVAYLRDKIDATPQIAIVLGTGLGNFTESINIQHRFKYEDIPHFPPATVKGHAGELIFGTIGDKQVVAQSGRYHYYEGYNMKEVTFPIRVFKYLGADQLIIASATGGIHEDYEAGDITVVNDHINLHHENPLNGPNDERLGPRFPDMTDAYTPEMISLCHQIASEHEIKLHNSVYGGLPGPNLETKAEYNFLHVIGATVVGMSTVPEIIVAKHMEMKSCVLTAVTNKCFPISAIRKVTHEEVIDVAQRVEQKISTIVKQLIIRL
jgi:purine-nucleoside phosphorylase